MTITLVISLSAIDVLPGAPADRVCCKGVRSNLGAAVAVIIPLRVVAIPTLAVRSVWL
ncbi:MULTISPECIES: hypothetical protein [Sphingomonas]|jgi:hypothetical protein|uniref:hypothetical protein n=1 Tax=Sphingomonas TaxID=13687 RepID=UPI000AB99EEE|nr:hypothetical protein [Sphingomonas sp. Leaf30]